MDKSIYSLADIQNICDTHEWSALVNIGGGQIEVSVYDDSDGFGVFTPTEIDAETCTFRLYDCPSKGENK